MKNPCYSLMLLGSLVATLHAADTTRPNVLFLFADDQRADGITVSLRLLDF